MTLITPEKGPVGLKDSVESIQLQLSHMRTDLEALQERIRTGDLAEVTGAQRAISEIRQWLKIAIEAETQIEKRSKAEQGIVNDYALDFEAARTQIGCRLDRLRRARCPGRIPRQSE